MGELLQIFEPGQTLDPHEERREDIAIGIDLGTTNSVISWVDDEGNAHIIEDSDSESNLIPSVVAYPPKGEPIVGNLAQQLELRQPGYIVSSVKRLMGRVTEGIIGEMPLDIVSDDNDIRIRVGERLLSPVEVSADILTSLKNQAEGALKQKIYRAVITVPAYFDDTARTATRDAARLAGLEVLRLVNEPTAAALAYGLDKKSTGLYAVYDLGGGTFDISILRLEKGLFQVLATSGDTALGGDDIDTIISKILLDDRKIKIGSDEKLNNADIRQVKLCAKNAKEYLSHHDEGEWALNLNGQKTTHYLKADQVDNAARTLINKTLSICRTALSDADLSTTDIQSVIMVGGSTKQPLVREMVGELFHSNIFTDIDPDVVVASGAAQQAHALTKGSDTLLLDVLPLSLGVETMGGMTEKLIYRNTPIPVAKAQYFTTFQDGQSAMMIHAVQGERERVEENRSLAKFILHDIPPMVAGAARIKVTYIVDADGLLTVSAQEEITGSEQRIEVKPSWGLSEDQVTEMLKKSLVNGQDDMQWRILRESQIEAKRVINAITTALNVDGDLLNVSEQTKVNDILKNLEIVSQSNQRDDIENALELAEEQTKFFAERRMDKTIRSALRGTSIDDA